MSAEAITADLDKCDGIVESITGERPYLMRAPSGGIITLSVKAAEDSRKNVYSVGRWTELITVTRRHRI